MNAPSTGDQEPSSVMTLGTFGDACRATAENDGWWLRPNAAGSADLSRRSTWPSSALAADGWSAATQAELLIDLGLAEVEGGGLCVPWERFNRVLEEDIKLPLRWTRWSPLMLSIDRVSELGRPDFQYRYRYLAGGAEVAVDRRGYFVRRDAVGETYHIDEQTFALVEAMDAFNALPLERRTREASWLAFARVKGCAQPVGAQLDEHLATNDVVLPSAIALDIYVHPDDVDAISFVPKITGVSDEGFRNAFFRHDEAANLYSVDAGGGKRVRVVLTERQKDVLNRMRVVRRLRGEARVEAERDPARYFEGLRDEITIEYGPRVIGIGDRKFAAAPANPNATGGFFDDIPQYVGGATSGSKVSEAPAKLRPIAVELPLVAAERGAVPSARVVFSDSRELAEARDRMAEANARGEREIEVGGHRVAVSQEAVEGLSRSPVSGGGGLPRRLFLLIYTNEDELVERDARMAADASKPATHWPATPTLPSALRADVELKPHQLASLLWLQRCEKVTGRRGVLLADDMGLGKTLQVLTYLAGRIEGGALKVDQSQSLDGGPYRPVLIVAPLILVENQTWQQEMENFFITRGEIFKPVLQLHGAGVKAVRAEGVAGAETVIGKPLLDAKKISEYRVVITNYETVVNYQHSLAQLQDGRPLWSTIVTDEAQKYKALNTQVSVALKAISADFHIAGTGTPVENRLLDLWNIVDTIQPALLGTAAEFSRLFEVRAAASPADAATVLNELRQRLLFGKPHAFLIRRTKTDANLGLPRKTVVRIDCEMSDVERAHHLALVGSLADVSRSGQHLQVLQKLSRLYQHPALLGDWADVPISDLIAASGKLQAVLRTLHDIRGRGEKAIIFARHHDAQQLLQRVLEKEFQTRVSIINGTTSRAVGYEKSSGSTRRASSARKATLDEFRSQLGFAVIILSPFVAGIGLTIVEANHVIHYGRWWNPAVENQATDRAYRIGQTKEVFVHVPVLRDPQGIVTSTFDQKLDTLIARKLALAENFLLPTTSEEENAADMIRELRADARSPGDTELLTGNDLDSLSASDFEAAVAALYQAEGYRVVLTAQSGDGGADVVAVRNKGVGALIQAKHASARRAIREGSLSDIVGALDVYGRIVPAAWSALVVSNAPFTPSTIAEGRQSGIEMVSGAALLERMRRAGITLRHVVSASIGRASSFDDGIKLIQAALAG